MESQSLMSENQNQPWMRQGAEDGRAMKLRVAKDTTAAAHYSQLSVAYCSLHRMIEFARPYLARLIQAVDQYVATTFPSIANQTTAATLITDTVPTVDDGTAAAVATATATQTTVESILEAVRWTSQSTTTTTTTASETLVASICHDGCADSLFDPHAATTTTATTSTVPLLTSTTALVDQLPSITASWEGMYQATSIWCQTQYDLLLSWLEWVVQEYGIRTHTTGLWIIAILIILLLSYFIFYSCFLSRRPIVYTQHLTPSHATQLPPMNVAIDTETPGPIRSVYQALQSDQSEFKRILSEPYQPTPWLSFPFISGHLQTFFTARASANALNTPYITYKRESIYVNAGSPFLQPGEVALDWCVLGKDRNSTPVDGVHEFHKQFTTTTPTVLILHGLAGGGSEHYVKNFCFHLSHERGYRCVVFNARGCGESKLINGQLYSGAYTDDLRQVVQSIRSRLPDAPLLGVGFSLGANILTKFVGEEGIGGYAPFDAVAVLSNPFDFLLGARHLDSNWLHQHIYSRNLAKNLVHLFKKHMDVLEKSRKGKRVPDANHDDQHLNGLLQSTTSYDLDAVFASPTLREFDKRLTRVVFGYSTVDDYYRDASSSRFVKFIRSPTLMLSALDDPISTHTAIPYDEACINPYVTLVTTVAGGHSMDFFTGCCRVRSWSAQVVSAYFKEILEGLPPLSKSSSSQPIEITTPPPHSSFSGVAYDVFPASPLRMNGVHTSNSPISPSATNWSQASNGRIKSPVSNGTTPDYGSRQFLASENLSDSVQSAIDLEARLEQMAETLQRQQQEEEELFTPINQ